MSTATLPADFQPTVAFARGRRHRLGAVAAGDDAAMAEVWATYVGPIRGLARSLGSSSAADVDDVIQETMTRVWKAAERFDPGRGSEATFVFTIARRVIVDRWRKQSRRVVESTLEDVHPADSTDESSIDRTTLRLVLVDALAGLSPAHRQVIEMGYVDGLSQSEIAARADVPLGTVKTRTFKALRQLRLVLAN